MMSDGGLPSSTSKVQIMGIVNVTPDSFWKGSRGLGHQGAELALKLVEEGADILDLGAESSRPGSEYVGAEEEIRRLIPVIEEIRRYSSVPLSIDTRKKVVMEAAWQQGASIVNDISALEDDPELGVFAAQKGLPVILMHKQGIPSTMQDNPLSDNALHQVNDYLQQRVQVALSLGIESDKIWLDPGIGFGKDFQANKNLVTECGTLCGGKYPVVMGVSRKSFVAQMIGRNSAPEDRLAGTLATNMMAVMAGASILRVHDVAATRDMLLVLENLKSERISSIS
ncbi:MAG: dihydropteroate synthase [Spirochaetaceae bacterium]|nr:dihydropteroate synthase [Spirochaetaceae bacterium]